jgi:hypothetical protein
MDANDPNPMAIPEVPDMDDCDVLLTASTRRDPCDSLYLRMQEFWFRGRLFYAIAMTYDRESDTTIEDYDLGIRWVPTIAAAAGILRETALECFGKNRYTLCSTTKRALRQSR